MLQFILEAKKLATSWANHKHDMPELGSVNIKMCLFLWILVDVKIMSYKSFLLRLLEGKVMYNSSSLPSGHGPNTSSLSTQPFVGGAPSSLA